jgi:hypothetical protein
VIRELGNSLKKRSDEFGLIPLYFIKCYQKGSCLATDYTLAKSGLLLSHSVRLRSAPAPTHRTYPSGLRLLGESSASPSPENHAGKGGITGNYPEMDVCRIDLPTKAESFDLVRLLLERKQNVLICSEKFFIASRLFPF